jgi:hypothetical protein
MDLLFVSYKAPPHQAARSTRLASIGRQLMQRGHRLQVYSVDTGGDDHLMLHKLEAADIVRAPAGPLERGRQLLAATGAARRAGSSRAFWIRAKDAVKNVLLPDQQVEWAVHLLGSVPVRPPDAVVSFIPPFTGALVGHVLARRHRVPHVLDYGDPWSFRLGHVPAWKRRAEQRLERHLLGQAAGAVVNASPMAGGLEQRFGDRVRIACLTSGFDSDEYDPDPPPPSHELRHLGVLTDMRLPLEPLARALSGHPLFDRAVLYGKRSYVHLPEEFEERAPVPHRDAVHLMQTAGALLLIGNRGGLQIPSKVYNYLGSGRPILAVVESLDDPVAQLDMGQQGVVVRNEKSALFEGLDRVGELISTSFEPTEAYTWNRISREYERLLSTWCA